MKTKSKGPLNRGITSKRRALPHGDRLVQPHLADVRPGDLDHLGVDLDAGQPAAVSLEAQAHDDGAVAGGRADFQTPFRPGAFDEDAEQGGVAGGGVPADAWKTLDEFLAELLEVGRRAHRVHLLAWKGA